MSSPPSTRKRKSDDLETDSLPADFAAAHAVPASAASATVTAAPTATTTDHEDSGFAPTASKEDAAVVLQLAPAENADMIAEEKAKPKKKNQKAQQRIRQEKVRMREAKAAARLAAAAGDVPAAPAQEQTAANISGAKGGSNKKKPRAPLLSNKERARLANERDSNNKKRKISEDSEPTPSPKEPKAQQTTDES